MRFLVEKYEDKSDAWQQNVKTSISVATQANLPCFESFVNKSESLAKVCQTICILKQKI